MTVWQILTWLIAAMSAAAAVILLDMYVRRLVRIEVTRLIEEDDAGTLDYRPNVPSHRY